MSGVSRWRESGHLERAVQTAGGQEAFDASVAAMLDDARGWRLAEMRKRRGMTQEQVAARMGVSVARVSQIESGDVSTQDVLSRFVAALGGTLKLTHRRLWRRAAQTGLAGCAACVSLRTHPRRRGAEARTPRRARHHGAAPRCGRRAVPETAA
jgi:transcriptional regulator with XRE-family HTH domain